MTTARNVVTDRHSHYPRPREPYSSGGIDVVPADAALGAEIRGVDFSRPIGDDAAQAMRQAWSDHLVLLWRGQSMTVEQFVPAGRIFGVLPDLRGDRYRKDGARRADTRHRPDVADGRPLPAEVTVLENDPAKNNDGDVSDGYKYGLRYHPVNWHTDESYRESPPDGSMLYLTEVPEKGGATNFGNMYEAYDQLPVELRAEVEGLSIRQNASQNSANIVRKGHTPPEDVSKGEGVEHPIIRTHPVTGRKCLYLGRRPYAYIPGMAVEQSEALLDRLWAHATQDRFIWWRRDGNRPGDVILWDNRCTMHHRDAFDPNDRRFAYRLLVTEEATNA